MTARQLISVVLCLPLVGCSASSSESRPSQEASAFSTYVYEIKDAPESRIEIKVHPDVTHSADSGSKALSVKVNRGEQVTAGAYSERMFVDGRPLEWKDGELFFDGESLGSLQAPWTIYVKPEGIHVNGELRATL